MATMMVMLIMPLARSSTSLDNRISILGQQMLLPSLQVISSTQNGEAIEREVILPLDRFLNLVAQVLADPRNI